MKINPVVSSYYSQPNFGNASENYLNKMKHEADISKPKERNFFPKKIYYKYLTMLSKPMIEDKDVILDYRDDINEYLVLLKNRAESASSDMLQILHNMKKANDEFKKDFSSKIGIVLH